MTTLTSFSSLEISDLEVKGLILSLFQAVHGGRQREETLTAVHSISATKKNTGKKMAEIETFLSDSF